MQFRVVGVLEKLGVRRGLGFGVGFGCEVQRFGFLSWGSSQELRMPEASRHKDIGSMRIYESCFAVCSFGAKVVRLELRALGLPLEVHG